MNLHPFDKVLVRDEDDEYWDVQVFSRFIEGDDYPFRCINNSYCQCISYKDNESLLGTTKPYMPKWEPKVKELVLVTRGNEVWFPAFFASYRDDSLYPYSVFTYVNSNGFVGGITDVCDIKPFKQEDM